MSKTTKLTPTQNKLFGFIRDFIDENRYPPSHRQMAKSLNYKAVRTVQQLLEQLEEKKYIEHTPGISRSLRILKRAK